MATVRVIVNLIKEYRIVLVPASMLVGAPVCVLVEDDCCGGSGVFETGSGAGDRSCCTPMPPDVFFATKADWHFGGPCDCLPLCVRMVYDPARDAWYSAGPINSDCPGTVTQFFRVRCRAGLWHWEAVDSADNVTLAGVLHHVVCDPFFLVAWFDDRGPGALCGDLFSYVISEVDCTESGSPGGGVEVPCCPGTDVPLTLTATFGGSLAGLGAVTLTYDGGMSFTWSGTASGGPCGTVFMTFLCDFSLHKWAVALLGDCQGGFTGVAADSCSPFLLGGTFMSSGTCPGTATVQVAA